MHEATCAKDASAERWLVSLQHTPGRPAVTVRDSLALVVTPKHTQRDTDFE